MWNYHIINNIFDNSLQKPHKTVFTRLARGLFGTITILIYNNNILIIRWRVRFFFFFFGSCVTYNPSPPLNALITHVWRDFKHTSLAEVLITWTKSNYIHTSSIVIVVVVVVVVVVVCTRVLRFNSILQ
jgi:hypothetical protein